MPWLQGRIEALPPHRIDFAGGITLPTGFGGPAAYGIVLEGDQDQYGMTSEESAYWDLIDAEYPMPCHYFLGYPNQIQDSINEDEFLFQIDTDDRLNVMWGDVGILYACIPKSSLEKRSFKDCEITQEGY